METVEYVDAMTGRKYQALRDGDMQIIKGPPEGLVDQLGLPEPFATRLHNILFSRGLFSSREVRQRPNELIGALQEALTLDIQRLNEAYFNYEKEVSNG